MRRDIRYWAENLPRAPFAHSNSVNLSTPSTRTVFALITTGTACQECDFKREGVEWSAVIARTSGLRERISGIKESTSSITFTFRSKSPSSPELSAGFI